MHIRLSMTAFHLFDEGLNHDGHLGITLEQVILDDWKTRPIEADAPGGTVLIFIKHGTGFRVMGGRILAIPMLFADLTFTLYAGNSRI
jgi:hypothetical protein